MKRSPLILFTALLGSAFAGEPTPVTLLDEPEKHWLPFGLELALVSQEQDYVITSFATDYQPPRIVAPKITRKDVDHLIPRELPAFIRDPLVEQARKEGQKIADEQAAAARASLPSVDDNLIEGLENHAETATLKLDYSPVPFFSVFGLVGRIDGYVDVALADPFKDLRVDYEGWVYGGGATLAAGYDMFFAAVTGIYTHADLEGGDAGIDTLIATPKVGIHGKRGAIYAGAHYQQTQHRQQGSITVEPLGDINFDVELEDAENWSWIVGGVLNVTERCFVSAEGGFGERKQALVSVGFRF